MNGYVQNLTPVYKYAFKMHIAPNQKVPLDDLHASYGVKHGIEEGLEFAEWIRNVKVRDQKTWAVVFEGVNLMVGATPQATPKKETGKVEIEGEVLSVGDNPVELPKPKKPRRRPETFTQAAIPRKEPITDTDILNLPIGPNLKKELEKVKDVKVLRYALNRAKHMPDKAIMMKMLKDRINDLQYQF
jgi:hypothetical protein